MTTNSISELIKHYETFIVNSQGLIRSLEGVARVAITFSMREDSELFIETCSTVLNVLELYNEHLMTKHKKLNIEIQQDPRFGPLYRVNQILKLIQHVSMLLEMYITHSTKYSHWKWSLILCIESWRCLLKLFAVYRIQNAAQAPIYIHHTLLPTDSDLHTERTELLRLDFTDHPSEEPPDVSLGSRTKRHMPNINAYMASRKQRACTVLLKKYHGRGSRFKIFLAEFLHAVRPVIYVLTLIRFGSHSWKPWLTSLLIEFSSYFLLHTANDQGKCVSTENARRFSLYNYLFKSPMFDIALKPIILWLCHVFKRIPLIGSVIVNILEYTLSIQHYYFYTEL